MENHPLEEILERKWEEYKTKVKEGGNAQKIYQEEVWPILLQLWKERPKVIPAPKKFDISIHTLGTSPEATILAILGTQADEIYILHTPETKAFIAKLENETGKKTYPIEVGKSDVAAIYNEVIKILEKNPDKWVALDLTSGTKAMSSGLGAAGFFFRRFFDKLRVVYVDNDLYDVEVRRPKAGSERMVILQSPHEVLADVDLLLALEHYEKGDYISAQRYFLQAREKTGSKKYEIYEDLSIMYASWYNLNLQKAYKKSAQIIEKLRDEKYSKHLQILNFDYLSKQSDVLMHMNEFVETENYKNKIGVIGLAETLLKLSKEASKNEELALSALYSYRALELLLQHRLHELDKPIETEKIPTQELEQLKQKLSTVINQPPDSIKLKPKLGLLELVVYLSILNDEAVREVFDDESIKKLCWNLEARNASLLIHGLKTPSEKENERLQEKAEKLAKAIKKSENISFSVEAIKIDKRILRLEEL